MVDSMPSNTAEIIKDRLYWISDKAPPKNQTNAYFFCIDQELIYEPFFADFGPLNLGMTYRFCTELENLMSNSEYKSQLIYHFTGTDSNKRANAAYLICAYQLIVMNKKSEEIWNGFKHIQPSFIAFRDASYGNCTYKCTILDCLRGLEFAIKLNWFDIRKFNLKDYEYYERVENGDLNTIMDKFVAFSGPSSTQHDQDGYRTYTPEDYVPIFKQLGVTTVIRLNKPSYESTRFTKCGIKHHDLYFLDGSTPKEQIINSFLKICENEPGKIAVHCKAGLGRTGTLICLYCMKHYHIPAADFIGWIRVARPGSVLGGQQQFLLSKQNETIKDGVDSLIWKKVQSKVYNIKGLQQRIENGQSGNVILTAKDREQQKKGDYGQGENLVGQKHQNQRN